MAKTTVSHELANKYPELKDRFGESIEASELASIQRKHGDAKTVAEQVADKKAKAPAANANNQPAGSVRAAKENAAGGATRAPRKTAAKKTAAKRK